MKSLDTCALSPEERAYAVKLLETLSFSPEFTPEVREDGIWAGCSVMTWDVIRGAAARSRALDAAHAELPQTSFEISHPNNRKSKARAAKREARVAELVMA